MRSFYLDLAKICFGVGFYGCVAKLDNLAITIGIGLFSLALAVAFTWWAYTQPEKSP